MRPALPIILLLAVTVTATLIKEDPVDRILKPYKSLPKLHPNKLRALTEGFQMLMHMHYAEALKQLGGDSKKRRLAVRHMFTDQVKQAVNGQIIVLKADIKGSQKLSAKVKGYVDTAAGGWQNIKEAKTNIENEAKNQVTALASDALDSVTGGLSSSLGFRRLEGDENAEGQEGGDKSKQHFY